MGMLGKDEVKLELQGLESAAQVCFSEGWRNEFLVINKTLKE